MTAVVAGCSDMAMPPLDAPSLAHRRCIGILGPGLAWLPRSARKGRRSARMNPAKSPSPPTVRAGRDIARLIEIMAALRTPKTGCPWDLEQDFRTIAPYTIEEAYEVADAIERGDFD